MNALAHHDSVKTDTVQVVKEIIDPTDSVQVAVNEEEQTPAQQDSTSSSGNKKTHVVKEPVWNPRKR